MSCGDPQQYLQQYQNAMLQSACGGGLFSNALQQGLVQSGLQQAAPNQYGLFGAIPPSQWGVTGTLTRYDAMTDGYVPVTMDWVNEISIENARLTRELDEAKRKIASYSEPVADTCETDRIWRALVCAAMS